MITKNLQSIRDPSRFDDFLVEIDTCEFDILCICETWRGDDSESWTTTSGHRLFFSGGSTHCGVGIGIGRKLALEMSHVHFQAFSDRVCALHATMFNVKFQIFSVYFPTSWERDETVEQVYDLLNVLMSACMREGATPLVAGDFNASIGRALPHDEVEFLGSCGCGHRNARGWSLVDWVLGNGLVIQNRMDTTMNNDASWTCHRSFDGALVQLDFVVSSSRMTLVRSWCDYCISIGLDHRCVHCIVTFVSRKLPQRSTVKRMRNWMPRLDSNDQPSEFQNFVRASLTSVQDHGSIALENILVDAAIVTGHSQAQRLQFRASPLLRQLRSQRRHAPNQQCRKELSLQIRSLHRKEVRTWKSQSLTEHLVEVSKWKCLKNWLPNPVGRATAQHPLEDEFADMLENLFVGPLISLPKPVALTEDAWTMQDLRVAIGRLQLKKSPDQCGVSAELLRHVPEEFLTALLRFYNSALEDGVVPDCWRTTCFHMLPKKIRAMHVSDFMPIANLRLLYKVFAYLILGRIEHTLDTQQPEEQHGFRSKYRLEEHLLTANLFLDKATAHGIPVWMVSLDLSKAFDRVHWPTLWNALRAQGISDHMIWMLSKLYEGQSGEVRGKWGSSRNFPITSGVRQGCVLSPRLFSAVLQWAMKGWRRDVPLKGFDLGDGQPALLDLRFADDILLFAKSYAEAVSLLHDLATVLSQVGLTLNASKTVVLTNEAQPPQHLQLPSGERIVILEHDSGQKWLGCILTAQGSKLHHVDVKHHLQQASKAFFANRWILTDHQVSIATRLKYFEKVVTTVACFAAGHRALYKNDLVNMDVSYKKLCRQIVGPPPGTNWSLEWHEILHCWNERVEHFAALAGVKSWSQCACTHYWKFARYVACLPSHRWVKRVLAWSPPGPRNSGRPPNSWDHKLTSYCRYKNFGHWVDAAEDQQLWESHLDDFINFCRR